VAFWGKGRYLVMVGIERVQGFNDDTLIFALLNALYASVTD